MQPLPPPFALPRASPVDLDPPPSVKGPDDASPPSSPAAYEAQSTTGHSYFDTPPNGAFHFAAAERSTPGGAKHWSGPSHLQSQSRKERTLEMTHCSSKETEPHYSLLFDYTPSSPASVIQAHAAYAQTPSGLDPMAEYLTSPMTADELFPTLFPTQLVPLFPTRPIPHPLPSASLPPPTRTPASSPLIKALPTPPLSHPTHDSLEAPSAPRTYLLPSATSRRNQPSRIQRDLAKRDCRLTPTGEQPDDIEMPGALVAAVGNARHSDTLGPRKSRARIAGSVAELEEEVKRLRGEKAEWIRRVGDLEAFLESIVGS